MFDKDKSKILDDFIDIQDDDVEIDDFIDIQDDNVEMDDIQDDNVKMDDIQDDNVKMDDIYSEKLISQAFKLIAGTLDVETISKEELIQIKEVRMQILTGAYYNK